MIGPRLAGRCLLGEGGLKTYLFRPSEVPCAPPTGSARLSLPPFLVSLPSFRLFEVTLDILLFLALVMMRSNPHLPQARARVSPLPPKRFEALPIVKLIGAPWG